MSSTAIWWIRRDLRLSDNQALTEALSKAEVVIPLFILDPQLLDSPYASQARLRFLLDGLCALDADLRARGSQLIIRQGNPTKQLHILMNETGATEIYAEMDISPYARKRDGRVSQELPLKHTLGITAHPIEALRKSDGYPYTVFTPFSRMWRSLPLSQTPLPAPQHLPALPTIASIMTANLPYRSSISFIQAGEAEAQRRLEQFSRFLIKRYTDDRNRLDLDGTSGLSPYLRFGMLSARQAVWATREIKSLTDDANTSRAVESWLNELIWREFYMAILYRFPSVRETPFRTDLPHIPWRDAPDDFNAWAEGRTGFPVVDAAMRQLNATGWIHNRARMISASFLTKDLLIDWRKGERYFMQHLLDGDPAANNGGWQWIAGTGTDAAPFFRVFNPVLQGKKFDPLGVYVRRWVPELKAVPATMIHTPWYMSIAEQKRVGTIIGKDYPAPIIDHAIARQRFINVYRKKEK